MLPHKPSFNRPARFLRGEAAFTLMEVVFAAAMFSAFAVTSILAFTHFNRYASDVRYETLALSVAQERIDEIMTVPCTITTTGTLGPTLYLSGTTISPNSSNVYTSGTENNLPLNHDSFNLTRTTTISGTTPQALTITLSGTTVAGADDTQVVDSRITEYSAVSGNQRLIKATVTVNYTYRGTPFQIILSTIRASDNF